MDKEKYCVYKHTAPNGKVYIGQTQKDVSTRWKNGHGYYTQTYFGRAIKKYGWENFTHEILIDGLTKEAADFYEKYYIALFQSNIKSKGYNAQSGGDRDYTYSDEAKKNISNGLKRHYKEHGNPTSIVKAREILQEKQKRKIARYDLDGNRLNFYNSAIDAMIDTQISNRQINQCLIGSSKQAGGYMWRYAEDSPQKIKPYRRVFLISPDNQKVNIYKNTVDAAIAFGCSKSTIQNSIHKRGTFSCMPGYRFVWSDEWEDCKNA